MSETCLVCGNIIQPGEESCPSCGYRYRDRTMGFKPVQLDTPSITLPEVITKPTKSSLRVVRSPHPEISINLHEGTIEIGRNPKCQMFLNDMTVSRVHAKVHFKDGGYLIEDNNSFNGVWVNGANVSSAILHPGDLIQIGSFLLIFEQE